MYHEEPELLPAASGTNTEKGAPPTVGGDEEPVWSWEQPLWPAEVAEVAAAANLAMGGAISTDSGDQTVCLCVLTSVSSCCTHNHIRCILV